MRHLGYRSIGRMDLGAYLPAERKLRPTLCVSDTHLLPVRTSYAKDSPAELLRLIEALPDYQVFLLGDIFESLLLSSGEINAMPAAERLSPLLEALRCNIAPKIVPGNHDQRAAAFIRRYFGKNTYFGGFRIGRLVFCHGHEMGLDASHMAERIPISVAVSGTLDRLGVGIPWGSVTNEAVAAHFQAMGLYPIFGHTHTPAATRSYANTGCFLDGYRSFATIEDHVLNVWEGVE